MPHALAVMDKLLPIELVEIIQLKAGKYTYTDTNGEMATAGIDWETFSDLNFIYKGDEKLTGIGIIKGRICVGKGINGSSQLKRKGDIKLLEFTGKNGYKYSLDFRTPNPRNKSEKGVGMVKYVSPEGKENDRGELIDDAYQALIQRVIKQNLSSTEIQLGFDLSVQKAKNFLIMMDEIRHGICMFKKKKKALPTYHIDKIEGAPPLEKVVANLPEFISKLSSEPGKSKRNTFK